MQLNKIYQGDSLEVLKTFPSDSIDCIVTSPPYYGLRDYGVEGQIGQEKTPQQYIQNLMKIFDECKRVLKKTGSCWVNIGDSYGGTGDKKGYKDPKYKEGRNGQDISLTKKLSPKSLLGIPERFVITMTDSGWIRRNTVIWHKPNCMPSSAKDRFTIDFEYLYFFTKSPKYYFETQYESLSNNSDVKYRQELRKNKQYNSKQPYKDNLPKSFDFEKRLKRAAWSIPTKPFPEAHFAVFPEKLVETPIKACCPSNGVVLDPFMGSGTVGVAALKQNKNYVGIELSKEYIEIAEKRLEQAAPTTNNTLVKY